jgi:hypothetical protein
MGLKFKAVVVALILSVVLGCFPTLTEIRSSNPAAIIEFDKPPQPLANCIKYEAMQELDNSFRHWSRIDMTEQDGTVTLLFTNEAGVYGTIPLYEIVIKPNGKGGSIIELRSHNRPRNWEGRERLLVHVRKCASK